MANRYWRGGNGTWDTTTLTNWSTTSGGVGGASAPTATDDVFIDTNSGTGTITCTSAVCKNLTVTTGATQALYLGSGAGDTLFISGSLSVDTTTNSVFFTQISPNYTITFNSTTNETVATGGKLMPITTFNTPSGGSGAWTLQDNWNNTNKTLTFSRGSFDANGYTVTTGTFVSGGTATRTLSLGGGLWTIVKQAGGAGTGWSITSTGMTFNVGTSNILFAPPGSEEYTFNGGGLTYNKLTLGGAGSTGSMAITGTGTGSTFSEIASTKTGAYTIRLPPSLTTTVTNFSANGSSGNLLTLNSSTAGTRATLSTSSTINYATIFEVDLASSNTGIATNSNVINSNNWSVPSTSSRWLSLTGGTSVTTPSDWPSTATSNIHMIGGGGGASGNITSNLAGSAGGGGGGYIKISNTTLAPSTSYSYTIGAGGSGAAGSTTSSTGANGGDTTWGSASSSITYVAAAKANTSSASTLSASKPTGTQVGDIMIAQVICNGLTKVITPPSGWQRLTSVANVSGRALFYKYAGASEGSSYTFTLDATDAYGIHIVTYRNALIDTNGDIQATGTSPTVADAITTSANNALVLDFVNSGTSISPTTPTGFTLVDSLTTNVWSYIYSKTQATAGTTGTVSTSTTANARSELVSLIPVLFTYVATGGKGSRATSTPKVLPGTGGGGNTGTLVYMGGYGGYGVLSGTNKNSGGGGGAAGPNGNGGAGGAGSSGTSASNNSGGGGGGNGGGTAGADASGSSGGAGGNNFLGTGGAGTDSGSSGTLGGGGGGSTTGNNNGGDGGNGIDIIIGVYGGGGGAGGAGDITSASNGGLYGGGGGGKGVTGATARVGGSGAQGAIFIGYTGTYAPTFGNIGNMFLMF